jgi:hypothetical protein
VINYGIKQKVPHSQASQDAEGYSNHLQEYQVSSFSSHCGSANKRAPACSAAPVRAAEGVGRAGSGGRHALRRVRAEADEVGEAVETVEAEAESFRSL